MAATASMAFMAVGALSSANASRQAGRAAEKLGQYNASVNEMKAKDAIARGSEEEFFHRLGTRKMIGEQRVAFAASGVDIGDPDSTASNVFADTAAMSELDALTIRKNAAREAWGYRVGAQDDIYRGRLARQEGDSRAIGTIVSTAGNVLMTKYGFNDIPSSKRPPNRGTRYSGDPLGNLG